MKQRTGIVVLAFGLLSFSVVSPLFEKPSGWPEPKYAFSRNPLTTQKIRLGRVLFYDPLLSADGSISCASCHSPFSAFAHTDHALSHGIGDSIGKRNAPALMNLAWQGTFMWDGAVNNLDMQALAPLSHPAEMGSSIQDLVVKLSQHQRYRTLFFDAFGDSLATGEHTLKALSQFMLSLVSAGSKYDRVRDGAETFTGQEAHGYRLFRQHCATCHAEPLFSTYAFASNGLPVDPTLRDHGRLRVTHRKADSLLFKIPSLRNVAYTYPYMHDGRFKTLSQVLEHYSSGIKPDVNLSPALRQKIKLSSSDKVDLVAFLLTLSDRDFVFNKSHGFPPELMK